MRESFEEAAAVSGGYPADRGIGEVKVAPDDGDAVGEGLAFAAEALLGTAGGLLCLRLDLEQVAGGGGEGGEPGAGLSEGFVSSSGQPLGDANLYKIFKPATKRAGVPWATFHTLRHTFATALFREGKNPKQVQHWLGHH